MSRIAPARFSLGGDPRAYALRRGLVTALVPMVADQNTAGSYLRVGRDLAQARNNFFGGGVVLSGEACGPAMKSVSAGIAIQGRMPNGPPLSVFTFMVNRDTAPGNFQAICGDKHGGAGGAWTFQLSYTGGQLGLTRWGIADGPSSLFVPAGAAHNAIGLAWSATTARFFLNGAFSSHASGSSNGDTLGIPAFFMRDSGNAPTNASFYVLYVWDRVLTDAEFMLLYRDPWLLVRPREVLFDGGTGGGGGGPGGGGRAHIPSLIGG